jgi:hypothetical protein
VGNNNPTNNPFDQGDPLDKVRTWVTIAGAIIVCIAVMVALVTFGLAPDQRDPIKLIRNSPLIVQFLASPTPTLTSTPTPTPTITPSPTLNTTATQKVLDATSTAVVVQSTATQAAGWKTIFFDTFDTNSQGWFTGAIDNAYAKMDFQIQDGKYHWDATAHKGFIQRMPIDTRSLSDFLISVDAGQISGSDRASCGLIFRQDTNGNYYYFAINNSAQQYWFEKWADGQWSTIIDATYTSAIAKGKPSRIAVLAEGAQFMFFINDQFVAQANDATIQKGITGLAIAIDQADLQGSFEFDNLVLRAPGN